MTNAEKFQEIFKKFATEVWAFPEKDFLTWLNAEYREPTTKNNLGVDCISRQAVLEQAYAYGNGLEPDGYCVNVEDIQALPSVTPQEPKMGRWIANAPQYDMLNPQYICSECGNAHTRTTPYCEMCGAKMVEPQESEE